MEYIQGASNPFFYGKGNSIAGITIFPPYPAGIPEIPLPINQTYLIETASYFVPYLFGDLDGFLITFLNSGSRRAKIQYFVGIPGNDSSINAGYDFFNENGDSGARMDAVMRILVAGGGSNIDGLSYLSAPVTKLLSMKGEFTVDRFLFPWPQSTSPIPSRNTNGVQDGSLINFFSTDGAQIVVFEQPQDIRAKLNIAVE